MVMFAVLVFVLCFLFINLIKFLQKIWWDPMRVQRVMEAQGIKGPPYKFLHGNTKEAAEMVRESMIKPMELSHNILPRVQPYLHSWIQTYGRNFLKWHGPLPQLFITEPELIKEILSNRERVYQKFPPAFYIKKLLGDGLVTTEGRKWVKQRKLANHAFRADNLKGMIPDIVTSVEEMLNKWKEYDGKELDLYQEFLVLTSDIISRTAFGSSYIQGKNIFIKLGELATLTARNAEKIRFPLFSKLYRNSDEIQSDKIEQEIRKIIVRLIKNRRENNQRGDPDGYGSDFLGSLVKAGQETDADAKISLEDIIDECKTFYFAGHETTSGFLSWTALLLAINTEWQDKARKEVFDLFGNATPTSDDTNIARLKTMTMILNESLRLYPPVLLLVRNVAREVRLGKLVLPAGLELAIPQLVLHTDIELWGKDAHLFKPERFAEGVSGATNNTIAFLPFGFGPRFCVGQNLALMEAKIALLMILQRYSFTLSPAYVHAPIKHLTTHPQHGIQVMLRRLEV